MDEQKGNRLKIRIGSEIITGNNSSESYRKAFDLLFEKGLISESILLDFPIIVRKNKDEFIERDRSLVTKIKNSNDLWISTYSKNDNKLKERFSEYFRK